MQRLLGRLRGTGPRKHSLILDILIILELLKLGELLFRCAAARSKRAIRHTNKTSTRLKVSSIVVIRLSLISMCGNRHRNLSRHGYGLTRLSRPIAECLA